MTILKAIAKQTTAVERKSEGAKIELKSFRDGTLSTVDFIGAMSLEGRVITCNAGLDITPLEFGAGTLDLAEHDLHISVPSGVVIIPIELRIYMEEFGATLGIVECLMQAGSGSAQTGGILIPGTNAALISSNINTGFNSACTVYHSTTTQTAFTTNIREIWRQSYQKAVTITTVTVIRARELFVWNAMDTGVLDVVGPSEQLAVYASSFAGKGFITVKWIELPKDAIE